MRDCGDMVVGGDEMSRLERSTANGRADATETGAAAILSAMRSAQRARG